MMALGYDPGYGKGGAAVVQDTGSYGYLVVHAETISTDTQATPEVRHRFIRGRLLWMIREFYVEVCGVENQCRVWSGASQRGGTNAKALRGLVCQGILYGVAGDLPVWELSTEQVKQALLGIGAARADKATVKRAVELLRRGTRVRRFSSHSADAVPIAIAALRRERVSRATRRTA
jgi:Holliday junction resolvasome RuvABC endonuclease subunit